MSAGFSGLREDLSLKPGSSDTAAVIAQQGRDPAHSWLLRSSLNLPHAIEFDATVRHVSALSVPAVAAYTTVDARVGWRSARGVELSVTGRNLLGGGHGEFNDAATRTEVKRSVYVEVVSRF